MIRIITSHKEKRPTACTWVKKLRILKLIMINLEFSWIPKALITYQKAGLEDSDHRSLPQAIDSENLEPKRSVHQRGTLWSKSRKKKGKQPHVSWLKLVPRLKPYWVGVGISRTRGLIRKYWSTRISFLFPQAQALKSVGSDQGTEWQQKRLREEAGGNISHHSAYLHMPSLVMKVTKSIYYLTAWIMKNTGFWIYSYTLTLLFVSCKEGEFIQRGIVWHSYLECLFGVITCIIKLPFLPSKSSYFQIPITKNSRILMARLNGDLARVKETWLSKPEEPVWTTPLPEEREEENLKVKWKKRKVYTESSKKRALVE